MIEKPKRPKKISNQDNKQPQNIEQLIKRYDLGNTKVYDFLDELVEYLSKKDVFDVEDDNIALDRNLQVNGNISASEFIGNLKGNADTATTAISATTATKASQDTEGNSIREKYTRAGTPSNGTMLGSTGGGGALQRSGLYSVNDANNVWYNLINIRHRNGESDGVNYGMQIAKIMTNPTSSLLIRSQANGTWTGWETIFRGRVLYDNTSGTNGTVTLGDSSANYSYIEIYYARSGQGIQCVKVFNPNEKTADLNYSFTDTSNGVLQTGVKRVTISGTSITANNEYAFNIKDTAVWAGPFTSTLVYIYKVVGYR